MDAAIVGDTAQLRIVRKITKAEVGFVAQYRTLASSDKLIEALAFPMINQTEYGLIKAELDARIDLSPAPTRTVEDTMKQGNIAMAVSSRSALTARLSSGTDQWRAAFTTQKKTARQRGIPFLFSFEEWCAWWRKDDRWARRGRKSASVGMARIDTSGPFSPENVYCQKVADAADKARARVRNPGTLKGKFGAEHPRSRPVITPRGRFESANLAAKAYGVSRQYIWQLCQSGKNGWGYADN